MGLGQNPTRTVQGFRSARRPQSWEVSVHGNAEEEFTQFVTERTHALFRVAYALTGNQHAAEDLLQNALAKAFAKWSRISTDAEGYVKRIIYRDFISLW